MAGALPGDAFPLLTGDGAPSYADLLVVSLHKLVVDGSPALSTLYSCFLTVLANVSPYARGLTLAASARLCNLLELFASPSFLLAKPGNFAHAAALTEALTNLVQYQSESNAPLIYALARRGPLFHRLANMTVADSGIAAGGGAARHAASAGAEAASASNPLRAVLPNRGRGAGAAPVAAAAPAPSASPARAASPVAAAAPAVASPAAGGVGLDAASPEDVDASEWVTRNARAGSAGGAEGSSDDKAAAAPADESASAATDAAAATAEAAAAAPMADAPPEAALSQAAVAPAAPPQRWAPTGEWLEGTVKPALRLGTLLRLVAYVTSLLERASADAGGAPLDDAACLEVIRATTLVGVLPQPHPLVQRVYAPNDWTGLWLSTFTWSTVYLAHARGLPLFDAGAIRLFQITVAG